MSSLFKLSMSASEMGQQSSGLLSAECFQSKVIEIGNKVDIQYVHETHGRDKCGVGCHQQRLRSAAIALPQCNGKRSTRVIVCVLQPVFEMINHEQNFGSRRLTNFVQQLG